uniref:Integrator complex subunit 4 n=1 Tax=Lutzomyia longipalpis TaxID=7200 RepID=A0A7G3B2J9_LUTLO
MATTAYKRSSSELYQTIQEISRNRAQKRLRLIVKKPIVSTSITTFTGLLENAGSSNEALQLLIKISDALQFDEPEMGEAVRKLCEHFKKEQESAVRVKILALLGDFAADTSYDGALLANEVLTLLKSESSAKVICQALHSLHKIGISQSLPQSHVAKMVITARNSLTSQSHNVQRHALLLLGAFASVEEDSVEKTVELIGRYTDSQDSRVRAQAFRSILTLGGRGVNLAPDLYPRATDALRDDYECVRKEALQLVYELGTRHPEHMILVPDSDMEMRLVDAAFGKVCSAMCDLSMQVRTQAAELLGGMTAVGSEFLNQTLDKKLMSNLRRKKSLHERNLENFTSGEWSSGKKWADDAPKEFLNAASISLIATGACGALVHGLEDEFLEVRTASVDSMCRLALIHPPFASTSLDFLVDMFNDEIESVRLKAIYSLTMISKHITLREDQLETMLSSLEDYSVEVREGLHLMLGACKVSTQACLKLVVQKILDVLSKYPQDKESAFGCLQRVGQKHPDLCMALTPQLLQDHPFFDSAERDVEDPAYVCILVMLFNAAQHRPPMLSLFPDTTVRHYGYLRDTMPNFVPHLMLRTVVDQTQLTGATGSRQFLETLLHNIDAAYSAPRARQALLEAAQSNLDRLAEIDPALSGTANFTAMFLGAQLLIHQLQSCIAPKQNKTPSRESLNLLMRKCLKLQNLFSHLTKEDWLLVKQISLRASALHLVIVVKDRSQSALAPCQLLLHIAADISVFLQDNPDIVADKFTGSILQSLAAISDPKPGRVFWEILPIVQSATPVVTPRVNVDIRMCTARILEPCNVASVENQIKVTAGLIAAVPLVADIENLQDYQRQDLRIRIKYPDQNIHTVVPRLRDVKRILTESGEEVNNWRLRTTILLSHGVWTEATHVEIFVCLSVRPGTELELCKSVKIMFAPKPVKRGI